MKILFVCSISVYIEDYMVHNVYLFQSRKFIVKLQPYILSHLHQVSLYLIFVQIGILVMCYYYSSIKKVFGSIARPAFERFINRVKLNIMNNIFNTLLKFNTKRI